MAKKWYFCFMIFQNHHVLLVVQENHFLLFWYFLILIILTMIWQWLSEKMIFWHFLSVWHRVWAIFEVEYYFLNDRSAFCNILFECLDWRPHACKDFRAVRNINFTAMMLNNVETSRGFWALCHWTGKSSVFGFEVKATSGLQLALFWGFQG